MNRLPPFPSRAEAEAKLLDLIEGRCTRQEVSDWAAQWFLADQWSRVHLEVNDYGVWDTLGLLMAADLKTIDRPYLYDEVDFRAWLEELRAAPKQRLP